MGLFSFLKREKKEDSQQIAEGLKRTRHRLLNGITSFVSGKKSIDEHLFEEIETQLLSADLGVEATHTILDNLTLRLKRQQLKDPSALFEALHQNLIELLTPCVRPLQIDPTKNPTIILMVGVNGAGKTTTIGKLAKHFQQEGKSLLLAAGDTFRAAAVEQLQAWGARNEIAVVAQQAGADSASVIFDAIQSAKAKKIDIVIADTAGRLHTQHNLMEELKKIKRVIQKIDETAPHEIMLVLDAGIGQNALNQALEFHKAVGVTGITLTKLDGTAKGGIIFAIAKKLNIPIRFIGVGEKIDDLRAFNATEFVDALFFDPSNSEQ